jgi:hypothetical protein
VRLLPAVVVLLAACAAAGCTTVTPPPPLAVPVSAAPRRAPDVLRLTPPPAHPLLATVRPDPDDPAEPAAGPTGAARAPRRPAAALPRRTPPVRHRAPRQKAPRPHRAPARGGVCALGRTYGGWPAGSQAATICARAYGS